MSNITIDLSTIKQIITGENVEISYIKDSSDNIIWQKESSVQYSVKLTTNNIRGEDTLGTVKGEGMVDEGSIIEISAIPAFGCDFLCWSDGDTNAIRRLGPIESDIALEAYFSVINGTNIYTASSKDDNAGIVYPKKYYLSENGYAVFNAVPENGFRFIDWVNIDTSEIYSLNNRVEILDEGRRISLMARFDIIDN